MAELEHSVVASGEISVQTQDFSLQQEYESLLMRAGDQGTGAVVTFVGRVRNSNMQQTPADPSNGGEVEGLFLEHYPEMTEKALATLIDEAKQRWPILAVKIIHRVGQLYAGDQIVLVGVASQHRVAAFDSCMYLMDKLKTTAPFWKKEQTVGGEHWVEAKTSDMVQAARWHID